MATNGTLMSENGEHGLRISDSSDKTTSSGHEQVNAATIGDSQSSQESADSGFAKVSGPGQISGNPDRTTKHGFLHVDQPAVGVHNTRRNTLFRRGHSLRPVPDEHAVDQQRHEFEEDTSMLVENPNDGRRKYSICGLFRVSRRQISISIVIAAVLMIAAAATFFFVWVSKGRDKSGFLEQYQETKETENSPFLNMRLKEPLAFSLTVTKEESNIYEYVNITSPIGSSYILENDLVQSRRKRDTSSMLWKSSTSDLSEGAIQMKIAGPNIDCMSEGEYIVAIHSGGRVIKTKTFTVKITNTLRMFGSIDKVNEMEKSFSCTGFADCVNARINVYRNNYERSDLKDMVSDCSIHYTKEDGYRHVCTGKTNKSEIVCSLKSDTADEIEGSANTQVLSECKYDTCQHGGTCTVPMDGTDYICTCQAGYSGHRCETDVNECASSPCVNGATCEDKVNEYVCQCEAGFTGVHCKTDINDCADINCNDHGSCVDLVNDYRCDCEQGYTDTECQTEINECSPNPCMHGGTCNKNIGGYTCDCKQGFFGTNCQHDIDECASISCQNEGTCINTHGGYECTCVPGYSGNHCQTEIRECESNPCLNGATCNDLVNKYECACVAGFTGVNCEAEIDECASHPCVNGATCEDSLNGFQCTCAAGFTGAMCQFDIDECASISCQNEGTCINTHGGYECTCVPGYSGNHCQTEIRECTSNPCLNGATCNDLVNKYECLCIDGFTGLNCETEIDECASLPCVNGATCEDSVNGFQCTCTAGFTGDVCELAGPDLPCTGDDDCVENAACLQDKCKCQEPYIASDDQPSCIHGCSTNCTNIPGDSYSIYGNPCGYEFKRCFNNGTLVVQPCKAEEVFSPLDEDCTCVRRERASWCHPGVSDTDLADVCEKTCSKFADTG